MANYWINDKKPRTEKAVPIKIQGYGYSFGLAIVASLMIFTTLNDIIQLIF